MPRPKLDESSISPSGQTNPWRRRFKGAAIVYLVSLIAAAVPLLGSDVCTQYRFGLWALPLAPLLVAMGAFVIFAMTVAAFRDSAAFANATFFILILATLGSVIPLAIAADRRPATALWFGLLLAVVAVISLIGAFFFCASMSV
ncbi:hypothetical protein GQ651_02035 [Alphaproteobacteria bacterium GH1-50]|uniref:Uncharacterized protein n=1 Tax=Kangsaoukella pontilimi TaxID=2691042 RepID=A0A7C9MPM5_9RHOB|nr:hypothetical protein [Kangsaoukella pontilimi]MXQ06617.1 hypothetical protein [Kangsaoukella pontilimi]